MSSVGREFLSRARWRKSSRSNGGDDSCVELAVLTEHPDRQVMLVTIKSA